MATIPMAAEVASLIGAGAQKVENRSLLLEKFCFHKVWPIEDDGRAKHDEASRWSFIRIASGASSLLRRDAAGKRRKADGRNIDPTKAEKLRAEAMLAESLSTISWDKPDISDLRTRHTRRFIGLFNARGRDRCLILAAKLEGRLAINLADSLIRNAGISLDRLFGMPYIPGSAVKGVARAAALEEVRKLSGEQRASRFELFRKIFGTADNDFRRDEELHEFKDLMEHKPLNQKGAVSFLPAYPIEEAKIVVDLTNVHFPEYYKDGDATKLRNESPQPNPFPCVESGVRFAFCLVVETAGQSNELLDTARNWLERALTVRGLGAKTAAGYGWFSIEPPQVIEDLLNEDKKAMETTRRQAEEVAALKAAAEAEKLRKASLTPEARHLETLLAMPDQGFADKVSQLDMLPPEEQRAVLMALISKAKSDRWKKWKKSDKDNDKKRVSLALSASTKHGIRLP